MQKIPTSINFLSEMKFLLHSFLTTITAVVVEVQSILQVEIAIVGQIYPANAGTLAFLGPAYRKGAEEINRRYRGIFNVSMTILGGSDSVRDCVTMRQVALVKVVEWYYMERRYRDGLAVLMTPGCFDPRDAHQLTANWNILYLNTAGSEKSPYTLPAAPIITTAYISLPDIARALVQLFLLYDWTTVYTVLDLDSPIMYFYLPLELLKAPEVASHRLNIVMHNVSSKNLTSYQSVLKEFKAVSRVMLFMGTADQLRRMMIDAASNNMTNGENVYIGQQSSEFRSYGVFSWQYGDPQDEQARQAFRSLLLVHPYDMLQNFSQSTTDFIETVRLAAVKEYGYAYTSEQQPMREILTAYSTVVFLGDVSRLVIELVKVQPAKVMNATVTAAGTDALFNSIRFAQGFLNTTYRDNFSDIYLDNNGMRRLSLVVSHFSQELLTRTLKQPILIQSSERNFQFDFTAINMSRDWPGGMWPPLNEPRCGFKNQKDICRRRNDNVKLVSSMTVVFLILLSSLLFLIWRTMHHSKHHNIWWRMDGSQLGGCKPKFSSAGTTRSSKPSQWSEVYAAAADQTFTKVSLAY